jgi:WD40 repeat protein
MIGRWGAALIAAAVLVFPAAADAAFPGANGEIAFERSNDIWTMNPDGSGQVNITNTASARETSPSWSADGTEIAFARDGAIWIMNADGSGQSQIVPPPNDPNACGSGVTVLGQGMDRPAWSPDSSKLAFHSGRACRYSDPNFFSEWVDYDLYTVNRNGTGLARIQLGGRAPRWSPDGTKIGYTATCYGGGCTGVRWTTPDGSQDFAPYGTNVDNETFIDWSPDGSLIDGCGEGGLGHSGPPYCFTVRPDGTGYTEFPYPVVPGYWSPDATKFLLADVYSQKIYTENTDGSNLTQIAQGGAADWQPIPINAYPRPRGASPFQTYLVPAYKQCSAPNSTHGAPLSFGSCNPPQPASDYLTVGTPDANGEGARSRGLIKYAVRATDFLIQVSVTDVRNKSDLTDYAGELRTSTVWRLTDRYNSLSLDEPATMIDITAPFDVPCTTTTDTTVGSTCLLTSGANTIVPGMVRANKRMVLELGPAQVYDGGADGDPASSPPGTLFLTQGIFIP